MSYLDCVILVPLHIINPLSENTLVQVDVTHLNKRIEVIVPNNIQVGHRIRVKGLGYAAYGENPPGDLIIEVSKITVECNTTSEKEKEYIMQKMVVVQYNDFSEVNNYLASGWRVVEFKPFKDNPSLYVYVLLEKVE